MGNLFQDPCRYQIMESMGVQAEKTRSAFQKAPQMQLEGTSGLAWEVSEAIQLWARNSYRVRPTEGEPADKESLLYFNSYYR